MQSISSQNVAVSTTPTLEGWPIEEYLDVASAHVVAGTNVFSDIAASFSDVFGGRPQSYQNQLEDINEAVINDLKEQAVDRGGTALVGLTVDHDQISGGNRQLLMVSATATVVHAERSNLPGDGEKSSTEGPVTSRQVRRDLRKRHVIEIAENDPFNLKDDDWDFVIKNQVTEIAPAARYEVDNTMNTVGTMPSHKQSSVDQCKRYFSSIPE